MKFSGKFILLIAFSLLVTGCQTPIYYQTASNEIPFFPETQKENGKYYLMINGTEKLYIDYLLDYPIKASLKLDQRETFTQDALAALRQRYGDVVLPGTDTDGTRIKLSLEVKQARVLATCGSISLFKGTCTAEGKMTLALTVPGASAPVTAIGEEVITSPPNTDILEPLHDVGPKALRRAQAKALNKLIASP